MEIITGYVGKKHVTSEQERDVNQGIVGPGSYVLKTGMQMEAEVSSNNEIKIRDGVLMHQGCAASIKKNTYDSLTIINGSQGMKRIDLIVARYEKNRDDETESLNLEVIQGTPAESNPAVPEYTEGSIQAGDYIADMPMYQVIINGLNITEVKRLFEVEPDIDTLKKEFAELNGNYANNVRFIFFTMTPYGSGNSSALITTIAKINSLFGITDATPQNSGAVIMNGDGNADSLHAEGVTWQGENLYAVFNKNVNGRFRITGLFYYSPAGAITLS